MDAVSFFFQGAAGGDEPRLVCIIRDMTNTDIQNKFNLTMPVSFTCQQLVEEVAQRLGYEADSFALTYELQAQNEYEEVRSVRQYSDNKDFGHRFDISSVQKCDIDVWYIEAKTKWPTFVDNIFKCILSWMKMFEFRIQFILMFPEKNSVCLGFKCAWHIT